MIMDQKTQPQIPIKKSDEKKQQDSKGLVEKEYGGPEGPDPTRYNDWTIRGRCSDF